MSFKQHACILCIAVMAALPPLRAQEDWKLVHSRSTRAVKLVTDPLGNYYLIRGTELARHLPSGDKPSVYSNMGLGQILSVDASDPFRLLLYYQDFNQLVFLDRHLSEIRSPVSLDDLGFPLAGPVCLSPSGGFWVFNRQSSRLNYLNEKTEIEARSTDLGFLLGPGSQPSFLLEKNDMLYLGIPDKGIALFDRFGGYKKLLPILTQNHFQVMQDKVFYHNDGHLIGYNITTFQTDTIFTEKKETVLAMSIELNQLYLLVPGELRIYRRVR